MRKARRFLVAVVSLLPLHWATAQANYWPNTLKNTIDTDNDDIENARDIDDDNDGIMDIHEMFQCGLSNASTPSPEAITIYNFQNTPVGSWVELYNGNSSIGVLRAYVYQARTGPKWFEITHVGKVIEREGPPLDREPNSTEVNTRIKVLSAKRVLSTSSSNEVINQRGAPPYNFAFRTGDKFDMNGQYRKYVIEYDWLGIDVPRVIELNEFGTYLSNGKGEATLFGVTQDFFGIQMFRSQARQHRAGNQVARNGCENCLKPASSSEEQWFNIKYEYILESHTTLKIKVTMTNIATQEIKSGETELTIDPSQDSYLFRDFQSGVISDNDFTNLKMYWAECDHDGDQIPNRLDLDSDNDGCGDAIEGSARISSSQLEDSNISGGNQSASSGNYHLPYTMNLGTRVYNNVQYLGLPIKANFGQSAGTAYDHSVKDRQGYCPCYKDATAGIGLETQHGITLLNRDDFKKQNAWPMSRKGGWTVLESNTKGLVIPRMSTEQIQRLRAQEGMFVYDTTVDCFKIYDGRDWKCFRTQACPKTY